MNEIIRAAPRPGPLRALAEYNPFYLLSALCMLAGLFSLNNSLNWSPLPAANLLSLILILNFYEILLISIAIFLARRGLMRDASTLLILEAFFLSDAGFLNSEAFGQDFRLGLLINGILIAFAFIKLIAVFVGLRLSIFDSRFSLVLAELIMLMALPGMLKYLSDPDGYGRLSQLAVYAAWWIVGAIPILYLLLMREHNWSPHRGIVGAFIALPVISILAHLCTANWVYSVRWQAANLSPLILTLSAAIGASDWHVRHVSARMRIHLLLPLLAIALSMPDYLGLNSLRGGVFISPLRLTLVGAAVVYFYGLLLHRHPYFGLAGGMCLGAAGMGGSPSMMTSNTVSFFDRILGWLNRLIPRTLAQWGVISVISSFILLGIGLILSLLRIPPPQPSSVRAVDEVEAN